MDQRGVNDKTRAEPRIGDILERLRRAGAASLAAGSAAAPGVTAASPQAESDLLRLVEDALRDQTAQRARGHRRGDTLPVGMLVNDVYLKLERLGEDGSGRDRYFEIASRAMRAVVVTDARSKRSARRGGGGRTQPLDDVCVLIDDEPVDIVSLDDALLRFAALDPRAHRVAELSLFGGLTHTEVGDILGVTRREVEHEWKIARAWLSAEMAP